MRFVVIAACTASKVRRRMPAEALYTGQGHVRLMRGVYAARAAGHRVDVVIASARHGIVGGRTPLDPYEATFQGLSRSRCRDLGAALGMHDDLARELARPADAVVVALGAAYFEACAPWNFGVGGPAVAICAAPAERQLPTAIRAVPMRLLNPRRFAAGTIALKGEAAGRLVAALAGDVGVMRLPADELVARLEGISTRGRAR